MLRSIEADSFPSILLLFENFFSLNAIDGYEKKCKQIIDNPIIRDHTVEGIIQWHSILAELEAIYMLQSQFNMQVNKFDYHNPSSIKQDNDVDIVASKEGSAYLFEVKNNSQDHIQALPTNVLKLIRDTDFGYSIIVDSIDDQLEVTNVRQLAMAIQLHIRDHELNLTEEISKEMWLPSNLRCGGVVIRFLNTKQQRIVPWYVVPLSSDGLERWLFSDETGKIAEALEKGADYLMCKIRIYDTLSEVLDSVFPTYRKTGNNTVSIKDKRLKDLSGIILFDQHDQFYLLNNGKKPIHLYPFR